MLSPVSLFARGLAVSFIGASLLLSGCSSNSSEQPAATDSSPESEPALAATPSPVASASPEAIAPAPTAIPSPAAAEASAAAPNTGPVAVSPAVSIPTTAEVNVEGEISTISVKIYRPQVIPIAMGLPEDTFIPRITQMPQWTEVRLISAYQGKISSEEAYVSIVWPKEAMALNQAQKMLFEQARDRGMNLQGIVSTGEDTIYSWERRKWRFEKNVGTPALIGGEAILGELNGQTFWVMTQMPAEYVEGFSPRIDVILKTLQ
ncbi:MAG: hypothetical protein AAF889_02485 [Cyanobacteria bacterium P01_D01_bin.73]